jgi:hypothetical protein
VSFNINRIRTRDEPRDAAWADTQARNRDDWHFSIGESYYKCSAESERGCAVIHRGPHKSQITGDPMDNLRLYEDDPEHGIRAEDPTYEYESDSEDEPTEYSSNVSDGDKEAEVQEEDASSASENEPEWTFSVHGRPPLQFDTEFLPLSVVYELERDDEDLDRETKKLRYKERKEYEHIAGPSCNQLTGYNGHNVYQSSRC